jgi:CPA1 family monovalent cation:H+ antiporter
VRLQAWAVWESLTFILNGLVFVLIGLQLPYVIGAIHDRGLGTLLAYGLGFSAFLIVLRLVWTFPGAYTANFIRRRLLHQRESVPPIRGVFIVGWTGMRGVISLAAAIALPHVLADGAPFAQRNTIIFLAFTVILVTLVLQGLTLPPLIRALGLANADHHDPEEQKARKAILQAAVSFLEDDRTRHGPEFAEVYDDLLQHYQRRMATLSDVDPSHSGESWKMHQRFLDISRELLRVERSLAVEMRNQRRISDELLRQLERELDLGEAQIQAKNTDS